MKNRIRLNEAQLHRVIKESLKKILREDEEPYWYDKPKNENDKLRKNRMDGLIEIIEYYLYNGVNSDKQASQLKEAIDALYCFGEIGQKWAEMGEEILNEYIQ